jgi:hypothetical protein
MLGLEKLVDSFAGFARQLTVFRSQFNLRRLDLASNLLADLGEVRELGTLPTLEQVS